MKQLMLILLSLGLIGQVMAQEIVVKGTVCSNKKAAIERATVQLFADDSTFVAGAISNAQGVFALKSKTGTLKVLISAIGFKPYVLTLKGLNASVNLGVLQLDSASYALGDVEVVAKQLVRKEDKLFVFPTVENKKYAHNGYTLLNNLMLPKIDIDLLSNSVTTFGEAVTLCINGRPVKAQEVKNLRPKDVVRIEYHDMPSGEFFRERAVIDYITAPKESGGYIGVHLDQRPTSGSYMLTGKAHYKKSEFNLIYAPSYQSDDEVYSNRSEAFFGKNEKTIVREETGIPSVRQNNRQAFLFGYNYRTKNTQFYASAEYIFTVAPRSENLYSRRSSDEVDHAAIVQNVYNRSNAPYLYSYYRYRMKNGGVWKVTAFGQYNHNNYNRTYKESYPEAADYLLNTHAKEGFYDFGGDALFTKTFKNRGNLSLQLLHFHTITDIAYGGDSKTNTGLDKGETLLFAEYRQPWGKWTLGGRIGGSYLTYKQRGYEQQAYFSPRPTLFARYLAKESTTIQYEVFMGNSNPALSDLSDAEQRLDRLQILRGNPNLKNTKYLTQSFNFWTALWNGNFELSFRHQAGFNDVRNITLLENGTYIQTFTSDGDSHLLEGTMAYSRRFTKKFQLKVSGGWTRRMNTGLNGNEASYWHGSASATYYHKAFYFGFSGSTVRDMLGSTLYYTHRGATLNLYAAYNKNNFSFFLGCYNPFWDSNRRSLYQNSLYRVASESFSSTQGRYVYARIAWNINFGKKHNYMNTGISSSTNSAILNVTK